MWFMPSFGRPQVLRRRLDAPGGWPDTVMVLLNADDPALPQYRQVIDGLANAGVKAPWEIMVIPAGSRCADAYRFIMRACPNEPFYGLIDDDQIPITPGWHQALEQAAGDRFMVLANGEQNFPVMRNCRGVGGELARAMGSLCPGQMRHNFADNVWDQIAEDFDVLRPCADVFVEHRHWLREQAAKDATYERGSADFEADRALFNEWLHSADRMAMQRRIAKLFSATVSTIDPKTIRLGIAVPIQDETVDIAYHKSLNATLIEFAKSGIDTCVIEAAGGSHVGKARERVLWDQMRRKPTHILFIDADMGWDVRTITRLLCADHEFAAAVGVKKQDEMKLCANFLPQQRFHETTKFLEVRDVGFAFVMLKVSVIEKLCAAYPELRYNAGDNVEYALFLDMIDKTESGFGERLSEDLSFCRRWRAIGGEIWVDPEAALIHAGRKEYTGRVSDLFTYEKPQANAAA